MEYEFTVNRRRIQATREQVLAALRGVKPLRVYRHSVEIGGRRYPIKQAFALAFGLDRMAFNTALARRVFLRMGFPVSGPAPHAEQPDTTDRPPARPSWADVEIGPAEEQALKIRDIWLEWSHWYWWDELEEDRRAGGGVLVPMTKPGVYEAKRYGEDERLVIGKASDLNIRVKQALVRGTGTHPGGDKIRKNEDTRWVMVRWALTDRPAAAEEELHRLHIAQFGHLPTYTRHT